MSLQAKYITIAVLFIVHFVFGYRLRRSDKPYSNTILTVHKLASLAALVMLALVVRQLWADANVGGFEMAAVIITGLLFIATILTGGLLSADKSMPASITIVHKLIPYLTVLSAVVTVYLLS